MAGVVELSRCAIITEDVARLMGSVDCESLADNFYGESSLLGAFRHQPTEQTEPGGPTRLAFSEHWPFNSDTNISSER